VDEEVNRVEKEKAQVPMGGFEAFSGMIGSATKSIEKIKNRGMSEFGLSGTHTICMRRLFEAPEGLTRTELAKRCAVDRAQITRVIGELLEGGYVYERGEGSHYRKKCLLTDRGREITEEINCLVDQVLARVSGQIPKERLEAFYETLAEICENLRNAEDML
jgi:DNA-binding MarR family transcriptional regulator